MINWIKHQWWLHTHIPRIKIEVFFVKLYFRMKGKRR